MLLDEAGESGEQIALFDILPFYWEASLLGVLLIGYLPVWPCQVFENIYSQIKSTISPSNFP